MVADDEVEFSNCVVELLRTEPELRRAIGHAARARVLASYNWEKNLARIAALLTMHKRRVQPWERRAICSTTFDLVETVSA